MDKAELPNSTSARALRQQTQTDASFSRRWSLVSTVSEALAGLERQTCHDRILRYLAAELSIAHGLIAKHQAGRFEVLSSIGVSPPQATRLPMRGAVLATSRMPAKVLLIPTPQSSDWCVGRALAFELFVPLASAGQVAGLLALGSEMGGPNPTNEDLHTLSVLGPILGASLTTPHIARPRLNERDKKLISGLTARETEVLSLLPRGMTNAAIAEELGMATGTAKIHVERILRKLHLQDRAQAAAKAVEWRLGSSE